MKSSLAVPAFGLTAVLLIVAGCNSGGPQSQLAPVGSTIDPALSRLPSLSLVGGPTLYPHPKKGRSWMSAKAAPDNLMYVADTGGGVVDVYSWRLLKQVGQLTDVAGPYSLCVDKAQNVYVVDDVLHDVFEYAHGGAAPIRTLGDSFGFPIACSVDPTTGNLAVTDAFGVSGGAGSVLVFAQATGTPTVYTPPNLYYDIYVGYDASGNLFVDGFDTSFAFALAELPAGSSSFGAITTSVTIGQPGGVQWDGTYLDVGDRSISTIYQFTVSGGNATEENAIALTGTSDIGQFFVPKFGPGTVRKEGNRVAVADAGTGDADKYPYPAGGIPNKTITGLTTPEGVIVSKGKK
ncbi:MAG: hypothetical protein WCC84_08435 [Candidatus Cybelea sp.]